MESKMTAVEWLIDQVEDFIGLIPVDIIDQAKEMHKQEIIDAIDDFSVNQWGEFLNGEEYYNETYGK
jgi:hypothetical protein